MKGITLIECEAWSESPNAGTIILSDDNAKNEALIVEALESHFDEKVRISVEIPWDENPYEDFSFDIELSRADGPHTVQFEAQRTWIYQ